MSKNSSIFVEHCTWPEAQQALNKNLICILPIGASCKEHGPHLPLNTDYVQARWLAKQVAARFSVLIWPVINAGYYPAFVEYPGSWSISEETFIQSMIDIIESIGRHGNSQIVLLNTGISTIKPLGLVAEQSLFQSRITLINVYLGERLKAVEKEIQQQQRGGHADEIETSIMLAIDPGRVRMDKAQIGLEDIQKGPLNPHDPTRPNFCPSGSMGNPTLATANKGRKLLDAILVDICTKLERIEQ